MARHPSHGIGPLLRQPTVQVARSLLGCLLVTCIEGEETAGMIVETEAYYGPTDAASHCYRGLTERNEVMFREAGHCYVYFIYGMHYCVNVVTEAASIGAAALIRGLEPVRGVDIMLRRRHTAKFRNLTNGPARLCEALGIDPQCKGEHYLRSKRIWLEKYRQVDERDIATSLRIGISKAADLPWRFFIRDNPYVSPVKPRQR